MRKQTTSPVIDGVIEGRKIVETIPQKGKKQVLQKILEILREGGLIK
ncbi:hypothetical protein HY798_05110 [Candidatus Falkowbacteria bacterium]|nr:hypothetical protein [Candidatus Falkowbacteria bacterium]